MSNKAFLNNDYYDLATKPAERAQWEKYVADLEAKIANQEAIYVSVREPRRKGTIGKIVGLQTNVRNYSSVAYRGWSHQRSYNDPTVQITTIEMIKIGWDDRKNTISLSPYEVFLEEDHDPAVGTVYVFTQTVIEKKPPKVIHDRIGEPVNPGDFVSFIHSRYGSISLKFGTITRITPAGTVFVQTLKLKDGEQSEEVRCKDDNVVIVNDQLMKRLVMAKLAAN